MNYVWVAEHMSDGEGHEILAICETEEAAWQAVTNDAAPTYLECMPADAEIPETGHAFAKALLALYDRGDCEERHTYTVSAMPVYSLAELMGDAPCLNSQ